MTVMSTLSGWLGFPRKVADSTYTYLVESKERYFEPISSLWKGRVEEMWRNKQNIDAAFFRRSALKAGAAAGAVLTGLFHGTIHQTITENPVRTFLFTAGLMYAIVKGLQVDRSASEEMARLERHQQALKNLLRCDPDTNTRSEWNQFGEREDPTDPRVKYRIIKLDGCECIEQSGAERV